ncbi:MAG: ABC transporter permease [Alphaproteobacteria bacterium]|nr:ABC transporter permease [Alphaproteobacteria bacterium]
MKFIAANPGQITLLAGQQLTLALVAVLIACLIGIPLGILARRFRPIELPTMLVAGLLYLIPSLVLFAFLIPVFGLGRTPAIIALVLYSLLVIVRNTVAGLRAVPAAIEEAARGIGMSALQRLWLVELPHALPVILGGVRIATVMNIGVASIAAYIGAGGLGTLIFRGIATVDADTVLAGAIPIAALALAADALLKRAEAWTRS